jgi:hypothetical protein
MKVEVNSNRNEEGSSFSLPEKCVCKIYCYYYYYYLIPPLCRLFTVIYLKQAKFLGYIVLQLFCNNSLWYM